LSVALGKISSSLVENSISAGSGFFLGFLRLAEDKSAFLGAEVVVLTGDWTV
jgi:hypothetical protein